MRVAARLGKLVESGAAVCVLAALATACAVPEAKQRSRNPQPGEILHEVQAVGARATLNALYRDDAQWTFVLRGIASGDGEWFKVAEALRRVSDAHLSEELDAAAGEALGINAQLVLSRGTGPFVLAAICGSPDISDVRFRTLEKALAELNRRIRRVERVDDPVLMQVRGDCLNALRSAETELRRFFGGDPHP